MRSIRLVLLAILLLAPAFAADQHGDDALYDRVRIALANDREIGGGKFDVKVDSGVVEISGKVRSEKVKERATKVAKKVKGVRKVVNNLQIGPI